MARIDHTNCTHPRTPAGRRACRAAAPVATKVVNGEIRATCTTCRKNVVRVGDMTCWMCKAVAPTDDYDAQEIRMTGPVARRMARQAAKADKIKAERIQPRRSGARVAVDSSTCVQAALHTRGRCACGWENWDAA